MPPGSVWDLWPYSPGFEERLAGLNGPALIPTGRRRSMESKLASRSGSDDSGLQRLRPEWREWSGRAIGSGASSSLLLARNGALTSERPGGGWAARGSGLMADRRGPGAEGGDGDGFYVQLSAHAALGCIMNLLHRQGRPILLVGNAAAGMLNPLFSRLF